MEKKDLSLISKDFFIVYLVSGILCLIGLFSYLLIKDQNVKPLAGNIATDFFVIFVTILFFDKRMEKAKQKEYFPLVNYLIKRNFSLVNLLLSQYATIRTPDKFTVPLENEIIEGLFQDPKELGSFEKIVQTRKRLFPNITSNIKPLLTFSSSKPIDREKALFIINTILQQIYLNEIINIRDNIRTEQISSIFPDIGLLFIQINDDLTHIISMGNMLQSRIKYANQSFQKGVTEDKYFVFICTPIEISISSIFLNIIFEKLTKINELFIRCDVSTRNKLLEAIKSQE